MDGSSAADARQQAFGCGKLTASQIRLLIHYADYFVYQVCVKYLGNESGTNALQTMRTSLSATKYCAISRFHRHNPYLRVVFLECARCTGERTTRTNASHKDVHLPVGVFPDFLSGGQFVRFCIGRIGELPQNDRPMRFAAQTFRLADCPLHALCTRCEDKPCT